MTKQSRSERHGRRRALADPEIGRPDTPLFSIGAVSRMTGIAVATIRTWEQRYGLVVGARSSGRQRLYSPKQVDQLHFLRRQVDAGLRIADAHRALRNVKSAATKNEDIRPAPSMQPVGPSEAVSAQPAEPATLAGIPLRLYGHAAAFVKNPREERAAIVPFVLDGLRSGEQVVFLHSPQRGEEVRAWFGVLGDAALDSGQLRMLDAATAYLPQGRFDYRAMFDRAAQLAAESRTLGYPRLRFVGQMEWAAGDHPGVGDVVEYEARVNNFHAEQETAGLCVYPLDLLRPRLLTDMLAVHPVVFLGERAHLSPFFVPPDGRALS